MVAMTAKLRVTRDTAARAGFVQTSVLSLENSREKIKDGWIVQNTLREKVKGFC